MNWPFSNQTPPGTGSLGSGLSAQNTLATAGGMHQGPAFQNYYQQPVPTQAMQQYHQQQRQKEVARQLVGAATQGWMAREASYMFTDAELAEKIWDMAEVLAAEGVKRGIY